MPLCPICYKNHVIECRGKNSEMYIKSCIGTIKMIDFDRQCSYNHLPIRENEIKLKQFLEEVLRRC